MCRDICVVNGQEPIAVRSSGQTAKKNDVKIS